MSGPARDPIHVVGGGLAGSEAAFQLAARGHRVVLHEMRGSGRGTPAHRTERLAELVCSNTFKSTEVSNAHGLLKAEMRALGSMVLECADAARIPAGTALAVDRDLFSAEVDARVRAQANITVVRDEVTALPAVGIIATGPLTSDALAEAIAARLGGASLAFYDAIAPVIAADSIDMSIAFRAARWDKETMAEAGPEGAYLNCPMDRAEYDAFIAAMTAADLYHSHEFEAIPYFEGCMPVEEMARRGPETLRHGPMRPVGLRDPRTGRRPWAVLQLRQEDRAGRMWNLVGCQTRMRYPEQTSVFRLVPGLGRAEFLRFGSIHRNSYLNAPQVLSPHLALRDAPMTLFAGQLTGVEGYTESTAMGLLAAINLDRLVRGLDPVIPPPSTMLGALYRHLREADPAHFQPMNANFGLLDELPDPPRDKAVKRERYAERALRNLESWRQGSGIVRSPAVEVVP